MAGFEMVEVDGVLYRPEDAKRLKLKHTPSAPVEAVQREAKAPAKAVSTKTAKPANKAAQPLGVKTTAPTGAVAPKGDA